MNVITLSRGLQRDSLSIWISYNILRHEDYREYLDLPRPVSHVQLSGWELRLVRRRVCWRGSRGAPWWGARVRRGHRVGSLPRGNSLYVTSLHHLQGRIVMVSLWSNLHFTWSPLTNVGKPIVRAGLLFLLLFFLLLFCFSLSLFGPEGTMLDSETQQYV